jgi:UDP-3-O-acyl N-acetylglucosamine deacetylase
MTNQTTLAAAASMTGASLHEGLPVTMTLRPAPAGSGVTLVRTDCGGARVAVHPRNIREVQRRTVLAENSVEIHTVEHVLAALYGMGVDNAVIELSAAEPPAGDGSSLEFVNLIEQAGIAELDAPRAEHRPASVRIAEGPASIQVAAGQAALLVSYTLDYGVPFMPRTTVEFTVNARTFRDEIAPARTFCLEAEAKALQAMGFGKGANTNNTLVVGPEGPHDNSLRFPDEYARHKLLDVIGDLAVTGLRLNAVVTAERSGHSQNQKVAKEIRRQYEASLE